MTPGEQAKANREALLRRDAELRAAHPVSRIGVRSPANLEFLASQFRRDGHTVRRPRVPVTVYRADRRDRMRFTIQQLEPWLAKFELMGGLDRALRKEREVFTKSGESECPIADSRRWVLARQPFGILVRWLPLRNSTCPWPTFGSLQTIWPDFIITRIWLEDGREWCSPLDCYPESAPAGIPDWQLYEADERVARIVGRLERALAAVRYTGSNPEFYRLRRKGRVFLNAQKQKAEWDRRAAILRADGKEIPFSRLDKDPRILAESRA